MQDTTPALVPNPADACLECARRTGLPDPACVWCNAAAAGNAANEAGPDDYRKLAPRD